MNRGLRGFTLSIAFFFVWIASSHAASIIYTFDHDAEGWTTTSTTEGDVTEIGHDPEGGFVYADDNMLGGTWYFKSQEISGDWTHFIGGTIEWDLYMTDLGGGGHYYGPTFPDITILSRQGDRLRGNVGIDPVQGQWMHFSIDLIPSNFVVVSSGDNDIDFYDVMSNVHHIYIRGEYIFGSDYARLDNVAVHPGDFGNLKVIGTATYLGYKYKLIYDKAQGLVWLDYWNPGDPEIPGVGGNWYQQMEWVSNLGMNLKVNLFPGFNTDIDWATGWRLPKMVDGEHIYWCDGTTAEGYNITTGELGHLYYVSLKNEGAYDINCNRRENWQDGENWWDLVDDGPFENLQRADTWYETETSFDHWIECLDCAWFFSLGHGLQTVYDKSDLSWGGYDFSAFGVAVRPAHVPIPTYTNEGENVSVVEPINHGDTKSTVTITFDKVEDAGDTTLYILPIDEENIPDGFYFGEFVFDIETTAGFLGPVTVCINNPNVNKSTQLWHRKCDNGNGCIWENVTLYPIEGETICGQVDSFSLFAIGEYSAKDAIDLLIGDVKSLNINKGIENSLIKKLEAANSSLNRNRKNAAANQLGAFINQINGLKVKKISEGAASELIRKAEDIIFYL